MLDILPPRPLTDAEIDDIKDAVDEFVNMWERDGCVSFIVHLEDEEAAVGYQYLPLKTKWIIIVEEEGDVNFTEAVTRHRIESGKVMAEMKKLDMRKNREYEYMNTEEGEVDVSVDERTIENEQKEE
jgi:hypothetical protein